MTNNTQLPCNTSTESLASLAKQGNFAWEAAFWKILSCASFAAINGIVRYLGGGASVSPEIALPTNVILFFQNVFGTLLLIPILLTQAKQHAILPRQHLTLHFLRVFAAVVGVGLWYLTLKHMPIAMGVALTFLSPVFTVMAAKLFLGERLGEQRIIAVTLSLLGAFIISRPDHALFGTQLGTQASFGLILLLPLGSSLALVWNKLLTRSLTQRGESAESLATYLLLLMSPVSLLIALPEWSTPTGNHWPYLIVLGGLAALAHISFGRAYAKAEVVFLTPIGFSKFLFSTFIGYSIFLETPSASLWIGMSIIAVGILFLIYKIPLYSTAKRFKSS